MSSRCCHASPGRAAASPYPSAYCCRPRCCLMSGCVAGRWSHQQVWSQMTGTGEQSSQQQLQQQQLLLRPVRPLRLHQQLLPQVRDAGCRRLAARQVAGPGSHLAWRLLEQLRPLLMANRHSRGLPPHSHPELHRYSSIGTPCILPSAPLELQDPLGQSPMLVTEYLTSQSIFWVSRNVLNAWLQGSASNVR